MTFVEYSFPTHIVFGAGSLEQVGTLVSKARPLIVTDNVLANASILADLKQSLGQHQVEVFSDFQGNPLESHVVAGLKAFKEHDADALIAFGGGAAIDVAKAVGVLVASGGKLFDYALSHNSPKEVAGSFPHFVAIPTTAGTGSEVGRSLVISDDSSHKKEIVFTPKMLPIHVVLDPKLHVGLPPNLTAATGMDALTHHLEAFLSPAYHPMCEGIALEGIGMVAKNLSVAVNDGQNLKARGEMINAAMMGAVAFQKGLGVVHSCAHALSTVCDLHHGLANALMLRACMKWNAESVPEKFERLSAIVGRNFHAWLETFYNSLNLPASLSQVGVTEAHFSKLVEVAFADGCHLENCRPVTEADFMMLYQTSV